MKKSYFFYLYQYIKSIFITIFAFFTVRIETNQTYFMEKSYFFYIWQYIKSVTVVAFIFFTVTMVEISLNNFFMSLVVSVYFAFIIGIYFFLLAILFSALVRYLIPEHILISGMVSIILFLCNGFTLFLLIQSIDFIELFFSGAMLYMLCCSLSVQILNENFIYLSLKRAQKKQFRKESQK